MKTNAITLGLAAVLGCVAMLADASAQTQPPAGYRQYFRSMQEAGMTPLIPASNLYQPGYIFRLVRNESGRDVRRTVCIRAFADEPIEAQIALPNSTTFVENGFNLGINLAPGAIARALSAKFSAQANNQRSVSLEFAGLQSWEVPLANRWDTQMNQVRRRTIDPACLANLETLDRQGSRFKDRVFMVLRATAATSFTYTMNSEGTTGITIEADIEEVADGSLGWTVKRKSQQSFEVASDGTPGAQRMYIAADIIRLPSVERLPLIGGEVTAGFRRETPTESDTVDVALACNDGEQCQ